jgi:hypothetical protein
MIAKVNAKVERDLRARLEKMEAERGYAPVHENLHQWSEGPRLVSGVFRTAGGYAKGEDNCVSRR